MRRFIMGLALLTLLFAPAPVRAQSELHLSSVSVDIWPEYDQQAVLVICSLELSSDVVLPTTLTLHVPAGVMVNAVAIVDPEKGQLNAPYERVVQGEWAVLTITTNSLQVQVEYYDTLSKNGAARHIVYKWWGDYAVDVLETNFLQPAEAEDITISPMPVETGIGQNGLTNYKNRVTHLAANQPYTETIDYQRQTDDVSISGFQVQAASTPGMDTPGRVSLSGALTWALGGIGCMLIVSGVIGIIVWKRGEQRPAKRKQQPSRRNKGKTELVYCPQCGKRAQSGDAFCRACGTKLKRETAG